MSAVSARPPLSPEDAPPFDAPWQAQAFALTVALHKRLCFPWSCWVDVLSAEIRANPARDGESVNDAYYRQWLAALESFVGAMGMTSADEIDDGVARWRQAYLHTPHGMPVSLANACGVVEHPPHKPPSNEPVFVSSPLRPCGGDPIIRAESRKSFQ